MAVDSKKEFESKDYAIWLQSADQGNPVIKDALRATDQWCDDACEKWYGAERKKLPHFAEPLSAFRAGDTKATDELLKIALGTTERSPAIAKATVLSELANSPSTRTLRAAREIAHNESENPMVRTAALNVFTTARFQRPSGYRDFARKWLIPLLKDESRLVRNEAARVLATVYYPALDESMRSQVDLALRELKESIMHASDRGGAHMNWAMICEQQERFPEAIEAYNDAIRVEPKMTGPRSNLAGVLERSLSQSPPQMVPAVREKIQQLRAEEMVLLARDARLAPNNPEIQYRYGLSLYLNQKPKEALEYLQRAVDLAPNDEAFQTALRLLKEKLAQ